MTDKQIIWNFCHFSGLDVFKLRRIYALRQNVFMIEQYDSAPYLDADSYDEVSHHLTAWRPMDDGQHEAVAHLRLVPPGVKYDEPSIGRVVAAKTERGNGLGKELMRRGMDMAAQTYPGLGNRISAQQYLEKFYSAMGFATVSEPYIEDGIPHIEMLYSPVSIVMKAQA